MVKIHDIETFRNLFVYCDIDRDTLEEVTFIVWDNGVESINQIALLIEHLGKRHKLVGYNSVSFDGQVLTHIMNNYNEWLDNGLLVMDIIREIYKFAQIVIRDTSRGGYPPMGEWQLYNKQLDLLRLWHFDNPARFTRLKDLQVAMDWPTVVDTPFDHTTFVDNREKVNKIISYCLNDIRSTFEFYKRSQELVDLRTQLSNTFGLNLMNANDPKIGSEIFAKLLSERMGITMKELKRMRTPRNNINIGEILLPNIQFNDILLQELHTTFKNTTITNTKGGFKKSVKLKGFQFDLGLGGIHGCVRSGVYTEDELYGIKDIDVTSFYPCLAIMNGFYPEHLGKYFCDIYSDIFWQRQQIPKKDPRNYAYKIMLNGVYGKSNDKDSYLYDPRFTMQITVNGQLLILMLAEWLLEYDVNILQANTDGLTIRYRRDQEHIIESLCEDWCRMTSLNLEYAEYSKMVIKDVNNYIGIYTDSNKDPKYKGSFELFDNNSKGFKEWHKDPSFRIVARAVSNYFINGVSIEDTICNCSDVNQFTGRAKFKGDSYGETRCVNLDGSIVAQKQQKTTRYIVTNKGCQFRKVYLDGRETVINKGYMATICNTLSVTDEFDINYKFYINEAAKIIEVIEGDKNQLSLF